MLITALLYVFFFSRYGAHRDLPSFPTRRSSDLIVAWRAKLHRSRTRTAPRLTPAQRLAGCEESGPGRRLLAVFPARQRSEEHTLNSSHQIISYAVFCLKKKKKTHVAITVTLKTR